jgi:hypothetical protein
MVCAILDHRPKRRLHDRIRSQWPWRSSEPKINQLESDCIGCRPFCFLHYSDPRALDSEPYTHWIKCCDLATRNLAWIASSYDTPSGFGDPGNCLFLVFCRLFTVVPVGLYQLSESTRVRTIRRPEPLITTHVESNLLRSRSGGLMTFAIKFHAYSRFHSSGLFDYWMRHF